MSAKLKEIRGRIASTQAEIQAIQRARPPIDGQVQIVRNHLESLAREAQNRIVDATASVISHGASTFDISPPPSIIGAHTFGLAVLAIGVENIVEQAVALAQEGDSGALRMPANERRAKLLDLARKLYVMELEEESNLGDADRRPGANAAAILGIPLSEAEEADLLCVEGL